MSAIEDVWFTGIERHREAMAMAQADERVSVRHTGAAAAAKVPAPELPALIDLHTPLSCEEAIAWRRFLASLVKTRPMSQTERLVCNRMIDALDLQPGVRP